MVLFKRYRTRVYNFILNRKLKKLRNKHETCTYLNASSVAVLFDGSKPENMEPVKRYCQSLRNQNKKAYMLCYIEKERPNEALSFDFLTRKNLNWFFIPDNSKTDDFIKRQFDLLINLSTEECLPLEYLSALSKSVYRIGRYIPDKTFCFDFMINLNGKNDVNYLIKEIEHYLRIIK